MDLLLRLSKLNSVYQKLISIPTHEYLVASKCGGNQLLSWRTTFISLLVLMDNNKKEERKSFRSLERVLIVKITDKDSRFLRVVCRCLSTRASNRLALLVVKRLANSSVTDFHASSTTLSFRKKINLYINVFLSNSVLHIMHFLGNEAINNKHVRFEDRSLKSPQACKHCFRTKKDTVKRIHLYLNLNKFPKIKTRSFSLGSFCIAKNPLTSQFFPSQNSSNFLPFICSSVGDPTL